MSSGNSPSGLRVALVHPDVPFADRFDRLSRSSLPPLGILYLAACLERAGHQVLVVDLNLRPSRPELVKRLREWRPQIVGLGTMAPVTLSVLELARTLRRELTHRYVLVAGGADATARPRDYLTPGVFDAVLTQESERAIVALANAWPAIPREPGLFAAGDDLTAAPEPLVPDEVPFPARHLLPLRDYRGGPAYKKRRHTTSIFTHRGCAYRCGFCEKSVHPGMMRFRSAPSMLEEIRTIRRDFDIHDIRFIDDVLMVNRPALHAFCDLVLEKGERFDWMGCSRIDLMNEELLHKMARAGCHRLELGVESGSDRVMRMINKGARPAKAIEAVKRAHRAGIEVIANFILGFPTETAEEMDATIDFRSSSNPITRSTSCSRPSPRRRWFRNINSRGPTTTASASAARPTTTRSIRRKCRTASGARIRDSISAFPTSRAVWRPSATCAPPGSFGNSGDPPFSTWENARRPSAPRPSRGCVSRVKARERPRFNAETLRPRAAVSLRR
ncbi:MAG: B12-binding domain-containing radical SAM protein [Deltaproteobacteria bacterium]|nr:B12-binding domain-containing radical SAM protein [Deltaproteobacteria bacterium]